MRTRTGLVRLLALLFAFALVAAACGDSDGDDGGSGGDTDAETADDTTDETEDPASDEDGDSDTTEASDDADEMDDMDEMAAEGEPIVIGVQNPEGDPNGSFPEYSEGISAAAEYINTELGGLGGRPIELEICTMAISPDDSQRCANELAADGVDLAISTLNFFGNHFPIYQGSDIPVVVGTPITIGDFTSDGVFSLGATGGCLGAHTGLVQSATQIIPDLEGIEVNRVAVPWADTPPGVVCYYDLEAKPLNVINGTEEGTSALAGSNPDLEHIGVPVAPATPDVTPQATEVLDFEPDAIIFSAQGADCWTFVDAMGRLGWTPADTPLILSGACIDFDAMASAGDLANGIYFLSAPNSALAPVDLLEDGLQKEYATTYQTKAPEYGMPEDLLFTGFGAQGFQVTMAIHEIASELHEAGTEISGESIAAGLAATDGSKPSFGNAPLNCANAPAPYVAVCSSVVSLEQWDGTQLVPVIPELTGLDLVAGTELRPGPS